MSPLSDAAKSMLATTLADVLGGHVADGHIWLALYTAVYRSEPVIDPATGDVLTRVDEEGTRIPVWRDVFERYQEQTGKGYERRRIRARYLVAGIMEEWLAFNTWDRVSHCALHRTQDETGAENALGMFEVQKDQWVSTGTTLVLHLVLGERKVRL